MSANHPAVAQKFGCGDGILAHSIAVKMWNTAATAFLRIKGWVEETDLVRGEIIIDRNLGPGPALVLAGTSRPLSEGEVNTLIAWADTYIDLHDRQEIVILDTHTPCGRGGSESDSHDFAKTTLIKAAKNLMSLLSERLKLRSKNEAWVMDPKICFSISRCRGDELIAVDMYTMEELVNSTPPSDR